MRLTIPFPRTCAVVGTLTLLATGQALPTPAEAGVAGTAGCTLVGPPDGDKTTNAPAAVTQYETPSAVPAGASAFTSPDGFGGREYMLGPSNGTCVAHLGMDQDFDQQITLAGQRRPAFEQVFGAGGDGQLRFSCRYLSAIRAFAAASDRDNCRPVPSTEHIKVLRTGMPGMYAALVTVEQKVTDSQLATSGTDQPVLAVVLAFDHGSDLADPHPIRFVDSLYADCRLGGASTDMCVASLQIFVDEAIAGESLDARSQPTELSGAAAVVRNAIADYGRSAGKLGLVVTPDPATQGPGGINTPNTRFTTVVNGQCSDLSRPSVVIKSDITGADVLAPKWTSVPGGFFDGQVGAAHVEARCPGMTVSSRSFTIQAAAYVALGDSYASGQGAPESDFMAGTNGPDARSGTRGEPTGCHRARNGYATQVSRDTALDASPVSLVACSGAEMAQIYEPNLTYGAAIGEYEPPQLNAVDPAATRLASLSIGGNDVGFADIVGNCTEKVPAGGISKTGPIPGIRVGVTVDKNCRRPSGEVYKAAHGGLDSLSSGAGIIIDAGDKDLAKTLGDVYTDIGTQMAPAAFWSYSNTRSCSRRQEAGTPSASPRATCSRSRPHRSTAALWVPAVC